MNVRRARTASLMVLAVAVVVWLALGALPWAVRAFTTFLLVPLPALLLLQARLVRQMPEESEREAVYLSSAVSIWILAALAMLAARFGSMSRSDLGLSGLPIGALLAGAALTTLAGLAVMAAGKMLKLRESQLVDYLIPRTVPEKIAFAGLSVSAGIAEELVFRSFLITAMIEASGSIGLAVAVSVGAFAVSHAYQGWSGVARVAVLGLILTAPFLLTGSIYPAMVAHAALDILAGIVLADWLHGDPERH